MAEFLTAVEDWVAFQKRIQILPRGWYSNALLTDGDAEEHISDGTLFWQQSAHGLFLYAKNDSFYRLHAWFDPAQPHVFPRLRLPVVAECFSRIGLDKPMEKAGEAALRQAGFYSGEETRRYSLALTAAPLCSAVEAVGMQFKIDWAGDEQQSDIMGLWRRCFHDYHSPLPSPAQLACWLEHRQIVCVRERSGLLVASLRLRIERGQASLWLVAVDAPWRGLGLNAAMMQWAFAQAVQAGCRRCSLWIAADNKAAIRSDTRLGFLPDGRISRQYILPAYINQ